jgi:hypothetical protein
MKSNTYRHKHFLRAMTMSTGQCDGVQHHRLEILDGGQCFNQLGLDDATILDCVLDKSSKNCSECMVRNSSELDSADLARGARVRH